MIVKKEIVEFRLPLRGNDLVVTGMNAEEAETLERIVTYARRWEKFREVKGCPMAETDPTWDTPEELDAYADSL